MTPAVSVIVPVYNYGHYLAGCLGSVLGQTFDDFEVIVVNDGSTDDTGEVAAAFLADPRVRYYRTERQGPSAGRNFGVRFARAPWIAFLDADDRWRPTKLEKQLALVQADPGLGVVYTRRQLIDADGRLLEYAEPPLYRGRVLAEMFDENFVCFSSSLVRRTVFQVAGLFDDTIPLAVDYEFWLRAAASFRFDYVDEPLVLYRTGHTSLSTRADERLAVVDVIRRRFLDQHGGRGLLPRALVRRARARLFYNRGLLRRTRSRLAALPWYVRALALAPGYGLAWQGLASLPLPERVRRWLRRALGRPVDWSVHQPLDAAPNSGRRLEACNRPG